MASVYKRREQRPIPTGAEIITYRGKPYARWSDAKGNAQRALLSATADKIVWESPYYTIKYVDHTGQRVKVATRYPDKDAALQYAHQLERDAENRRRGLIDATQERFAAQGRRLIVEHIADFRATMEAAGRDPKHVTATIAYITQVVDMADWRTAGDIAADPVNTYAADLLARGKSARTVQAVLTAIKSLTRWLTRHGKLPADPLAGVTKPSPKKIDGTNDGCSCPRNGTGCEQPPRPAHIGTA